VFAALQQQRAVHERPTSQVTHKRLSRSSAATKLAHSFLANRARCAHGRFATDIRQMKRTCKQDPQNCAPGETSPSFP
jgi:hypothetical protein